MGTSMQAGLCFLLQNPASKQRKPQDGKIAQSIVKCLPFKHNNLSWVLRTYIEEGEEEKKRRRRRGRVTPIKPSPLLPYKSLFPLV